MRATWQAVLWDLWLFFLGRESALQKSEVYEEALLLEPAEATTMVVPNISHSLETKQVHSKSALQQANFIRSGQRIATTSAVLYKQPAYVFDTVVARVPYGAVVEIIATDGAWVHLNTGTHTGWLPQDQLAAATSVLPVFKQYEHYTAAHSTTVKVRQCLVDQFGTEHTDLPLSAEEYASYVLWLRRLSLPWDGVKTRTAGTWQQLLKGKQGVYISITPHTATVMEYFLNGVGYLAYVEAVTPDLTLHFSGVGILQTGKYLELELAEAEWRELRPVFIKVT